MTKRHKKSLCVLLVVGLLFITMVTTFASSGRQWNETNFANVTVDGVRYPLLEDTISFADKLFTERLPDLQMHMGGFGVNLDKNKKEILLVYKK